MDQSRQPQTTVEAGILYDLANIHLSMIEERYKPEDKAASKYEPDALSVE